MRAAPVAALITGVLAIATAPVVILLAGIEPFALAAWRLLSVTAVLSLLAGPALVRDLKGLTGPERLRLLVSGLLYGSHFGLFNLAFFHTSKESVVVLLGVQPLMAAAIGAIWLGERITRGMVLASLAAMAGLLMFVWHDYTFDVHHLVGDALTLAACLTIVISYSIGRRLRPRMSLKGYLLALYLLGGLTCLSVALVLGSPLGGFDRQTWFWIGVAVLLPTLIGHSMFHYVVKYVPIFYVNLVVLGEPILSLLIMIGLRDHYSVFRTSTLTPVQLTGGLLLLGGVAIGLLAAGRNKPVEA